MKLNILSPDDCSPFGRNVVEIYADFNQADCEVKLRSRKKRKHQKKGMYDANSAAKSRSTMHKKCYKNFSFEKKWMNYYESQISCEDVPDDSDTRMSMEPLKSEINKIQMDEEADTYANFHDGKDYSFLEEPPNSHQRYEATCVKRQHV